MKTLWVISGGTEAVPTIRRAREMGLKVVVSDLAPDAPGFEFAHHTRLASTYDWRQTLESAKAYAKRHGPIDGVICAAADVPVTAAAIAEAFRLAGPSMETACLTADKLAMKERLRSAGVAIPWFSQVRDPEDLRKLSQKRGLPLVLKPVDSRGARGVLKLSSGIDLDWAYHHSKAFSPSSRVMVEEFLEGPQFSTESLFQQGHAVTPGFTDRNYSRLDQFAPFMVEDGGQMPTALGQGDRDAVTETLEQAARVLGIETGVAKGDMVLTPDGPRVIEIASRLSGGWFSSHQIPLATGVDFLGAAIRVALGESVSPEELIPRVALGESVSPEELIPRYDKGSAIRYFFPNPGRVVGIRHASRLSALPWVHLLMITTQLGDRVLPLTDHTCRAGFVLAEGETRQEAVYRAEAVIREIKIETVLDEAAHDVA